MKILKLLFKFHQIIYNNNKEKRKVQVEGQNHLCGEPISNKEKKYQKVIMRLLVYTVIPFGIKVHLKF